MKTYLKTAATLSVIALFATGCGKDEKKKSGCDMNNPQSLYSPQCFNQGVGWNPLQPGQVGNIGAKASLDLWMQQNEVSPMPGAMGLIDYSYGGISFGSSSEYCYRSVIGGYEVGDYNKVDGPNYCSNMRPYTKATNERLNSALNGDNGTLKLVDVKVVGSEFTLYYAPQNGVSGYQQPIKAYKIDTRFHSMVNPIQVMEYGVVKEQLQGVLMKTDLDFL